MMMNQVVEHLYLRHNAVAVGGGDDGDGVEDTKDLVGGIAEYGVVLGRVQRAIPCELASLIE